MQHAIDLLTTEECWVNDDMGLFKQVESMLADRFAEMELAADSVSVSWTTLSFYPELILLRVTGLEQDNEFPAYFVMQEDGTPMVYLDGTSPPIHYLNQATRFALNDHSAEDYLRFFCAFVQGEEGSFHIVSSNDSPLIADNDEAQQAVKSLTLGISQENLRNGWQFNTSVLYEASLFKVNFTVEPNGMITMNDDEPLAAFETLPKPKRFFPLRQQHTQYGQYQEKFVTPAREIRERAERTERRRNRQPPNSEQETQVEVFNFDQLLREKEKTQGDQTRYFETYTSALEKTQGYLPLKRYSGDMAEFDRLDEIFPIFAAVTAVIREALLFSTTLKKGEIKLPRMLLNGPPGTGKSRYIQELAKVLTLPSRTIDVATTSAAFVLSGSSRVWRSGQPGLIADTQMENRCANGIIVLEEMDKIAGGEQYPVTNTLYTLLEPNSARNFVDEFLNVNINCQFINWIATSNGLEDIPDAILSRFQCFNIVKPNAKQRKQMVYSIYQDLLEEIDVVEHFAADLPDEVTAIIASVCTDIRDMKRHMQAAMVNATIRSKRLAKASTTVLGKIEILRLDVRLIDTNIALSHQNPRLVH